MANYNSGVNPSERYLKSLCDKTFLSLWSYSGIYRDQNKRGAGDGKEVCDLIVVFENNIIIFSDKYCEFPESGDLSLDWNRWFKKAVYKSAQQAWGAERWIRSFPQRLFVDRGCSQPFPIEVPDIDQATFHLIVVAHNFRKRCQLELQGQGSLIVNSSIRANQHYASSQNESCFMIGDLDPSRGFVHVLGDLTLDIVLNTVDTVNDFVSYLSKKKALIRSQTKVLAFGEEDLLAYYLSNINHEGQHDFVVWDKNGLAPMPSGLVFDEGHWERFSQSDQRKAQLSEDRVSYLWDRLIEEHSRHILEKTQYFSTGSTIGEGEILLRWLAREPRLQRRLLSLALGGFIKTAPTNQRATRYIVPTHPDHPYYVFLTLPTDASNEYSSYRTMRRTMLEIASVNLKHHYPDARHVVGLATEPSFENGGRSHDALYVDLNALSNEELNEYANLAKRLNMFTKPSFQRVSVDEYPTGNAKNRARRKVPSGFSVNANRKKGKRK